ncbi:MFS transporter [Legionella spiritensis]|uniref:MFS transporter n=1 Tax=Legionella spiritensis TaxID=452 RepID=UPI000F6BAF95|nr:MFS transporter [Legionella spiritensis]VEG89747.1 drug:proton antiporter [Legionella spiritensis]
MLGKPFQLLQNRAFGFFTLSCLLAMFGNGLTYIIMVWALMQFSTSVVSTALLMTCFWLPNVVLGPFFGVIADRCNRKHLLLLANGLRAMCLFGFAWLAQNHMTAWSIYALAAVIGTLLAVYIPVAMTFVRELLAEKDLLYGNAVVDIAYEIGAVLGMGSAGFILATTSSSVCFLINGVCYLLAMLLIVNIKYRRNTRAVDDRESLLTQFTEGGRYILRNTPLLLIYLVQGLFFVCMMTAPVLLAPYAKSVLHSNVREFGWLEAMLSLGIITGGFISPWLASRFTIYRVIMLQVVLGMVSFYCFSHTQSSQWAIFYHFLIGYSFSAWALLTTLAQEMTALEYQGRVQSLFNSVSGVVIIIFYYILAHWKNVTIARLYLGEIGLLLFAAGFLVLMTFHSGQRRTD